MAKSKAKSLKDLLKIREANRERLEQSRGFWGSAVGRKNSTGEPAILAYVDRKISKTWLEEDKLVPPVLSHKGKECPTDVIDTSPREFAPNMELRLLALDKEDNQYTVRYQEIQGKKPFSDEANGYLLDLIRGASDKLLIGSQLTFRVEEEVFASGSLGCFCWDADNRVGLLTNKHVGAGTGNKLYHPDKESKHIAQTTMISLGRVSAHERFPFLSDLNPAVYIVDAAFAFLMGGFKYDPRFPMPGPKRKIRPMDLADPYGLDLDTMGPIGEKVISIGHARSLQRGTVAAFAMEYKDKDLLSSDYLIIGEENDQFSDPGDSGKIVFLEKTMQPLALMWGGVFERLFYPYRCLDVSLATDIGFILNRLNLKIMKTP